ncbi:hypothetical protein NDU88_005377 [Pleurodeles waltl]|uniref:Uncharacterized protein n=1 Tax=Pleurodeles waltl TaxID=8319 RepID=A0AAV7M947_PLEWA|nr:hypothetical protein NDU88_005377 [Pleurodeles waltl]
MDLVRLGLTERGAGCSDVSFKSCPGTPALPSPLEEEKRSSFLGVKAVFPGWMAGAAGIIPPQAQKGAEPQTRKARGRPVIAWG